MQIDKGQSGVKFIQPCRTRHVSDESNLTGRFLFPVCGRSVIMLFAKYWSSLLLLLMVHVNTSFGRQSRRWSQSELIKTPNVNACYSGRFVSEDELQRIENSRKFDSMTQLTSVKKRFQFSESCGYATVENNRVELARCPAQSYHSMFRRVRSTSSCCQTTMYVIQPMEVTDLYSVNTYTVKHLPSAYQLLHAGYCGSEGSACGVGGTCTQSYRIDWVLVEKPTGDDFVPATFKMSLPISFSNIHPTVFFAIHLCQWLARAAMATTATAQAQQKFSNLRRRLDQLGYQQPLGVESLPLVEKLFADLVHTTESLKNAKQQLGQKQTESLDMESATAPYKSDNARLIKENNELHIQLVKQKEDMDAVLRELKSSLRKLEHENADLKFLNNQYVHKVKQLERESKEKSDRILQLQEKNFQAVVQTPGGRKKNIPFRRQRMEIDTTVPDTYTSSAYRVPPPEDPYVADLLQVADTKIAQLEAEVARVNDEKEVMDRKLKNFRQQAAQVACSKCVRVTERERERVCALHGTVQGVARGQCFLVSFVADFGLACVSAGSGVSLDAAVQSQLPNVAAHNQKHTGFGQAVEAAMCKRRLIKACPCMPACPVCDSPRCRAGKSLLHCAGSTPTPVRPKPWQYYQLSPLGLTFGAT
ncbi:hypothetical protein BaRGS_00036899 [Batillaria attramentaria]|uniref:Uncharacterized protein n=1 Tax=Batillaria attramentaria TaxID=370345 RepID=A0ABD0JA56_9CAEN